MSEKMPVSIASELPGVDRRRTALRRDVLAAGDGPSAITRAGPCYAVLDDDLQLLSCSSEFEAAYGGWARHLTADMTQSIGALVSKIRLEGGSASLERPDSTVLRLTRMHGFFAVYVLSVEGVRRGSNVPEIARRFGLSARESEVLGLILKGKTHLQIALQLSISGATVASHVRNIGIKFGCSKRSSIVARALGLI